jgi:outer membrane murein-binding lipoprotein Lpp
MMTFGLDIIADILLGVGALAAAFYCVALSRKLSRLTGLDQELGTAIAVLSQQVDEMTQVLQTAQASANDAREKLSEMTERAEDAAMKLQAETAQPAQPAPAAQDTLVLDQPVQQPAPDPEPRDSGGLADGNTSIFMRHTRVAS